MKTKCRLFLVLMSVLLVAGCETVSNRDRTVLREHGVSGDVYDKMLYDDPLSVADVIELSDRGVPPALIIHYMNETDAVYRLQKAAVTRLKAAGVSEEVIAFMESTGSDYGSYGYAGYAYSGYYPYYDYDDGPYFWGGYGGGRGRGHGGFGHGGGGGFHGGGIGFGGHGGGFGGHGGGGGGHGR